MDGAVAMAGGPKSGACASTGGSSALTSATLSSVRRQRAALSRQRALVSESGRRLWPALGTKLQRLRTGQSLAGEAAEATRVAQLHSEQILALEHDVRGELLYMHALLCEELREHERKTEREVAKCRRRLLVGAARKRLQLLAVFGEEEAGIRLIPQSMLLPSANPGRGGALSRSIAVPLPTIADSCRSQAQAAVIAERWNVMNPTLEMAVATSCKAGAGAEVEPDGLRSWRSDGYIAVPPECVERFLLAGTLCGVDAAQASMAGGPPSQRRVRGQLGQNRQAHCAELVLDAPELVLSGGPYACLAACLSECESSITAAAGHSSDHVSGPTVGYAVRCSVALRRSQSPPAHPDGAVVLSGSPEFGIVECLAVSPHEIIMFVLEDRRLLEQPPAAVEVPTADDIEISDKRGAGRKHHRLPKSGGKTTGKHGDTAPRSPDGERAADNATPQAARTTDTELQAGITREALPHCLIVTDLLGQSHADDAVNSLAPRPSDGTTDADNVYNRSGASNVGRSDWNSSRGGWRVPSSNANVATGTPRLERSRSTANGQLRLLSATCGRWRQAEARLQQAIETASIVARSSAAQP